MNSYFDQQWDQELAKNPAALHAFIGLDDDCQQKIISYISSCDDSREAARRIRRMVDGLESGQYPQWWMDEE